MERTLAQLENTSRIFDQYLTMSFWSTAKCCSA